MLPLAAGLLGTSHVSEQLGARSGPAFAGSSLRNDYLAFFRDAVLNRLYATLPGACQDVACPVLMDGRGWPNGPALSMSGVRRSDHFVALVSQAVSDGIPGHVIETGVWHGGLSLLAAKTLEVLGETSRRMYLADSFRGIPPTPKDGKRYTAQDVKAQHIGILNNNSALWVQDAAYRFGFTRDQLRFVIGFFNESIPRLIKAEPGIGFAVVRLDGDAYHSTWDAITLLYPRLAPGGFLIVDDYTEWEGCRRAILDYRRKHDIRAPLTLIPHRQQEWHIGAYWRKPLTTNPNLATCVSGGDPSRDVRVSGSYLPTALKELTLEDIQKGSSARMAFMPLWQGPRILDSKKVHAPSAVHRCAGSEWDSDEVAQRAKKPIQWVEV